MLNGGSSESLKTFFLNGWKRVAEERRQVTTNGWRWLDWWKEPAGIIPSPGERGVEQQQLDSFGCF